MEIALSTCSVDLIRGWVRHRDGQTHALTAVECELLAFLDRRKGVPVSRQELLKEVWGYSDNVVSRASDSAIARLRAKIEADPAHPVHLRTVFGVGYVWAPDPVPELPTSAARPPRALHLAQCTVDLSQGVARRPDQPDVSLSGIEVRLLDVLASAAPDPVSRATLLAQVWSPDTNVRAVDATVWRLRSKIERDPKEPEHLLSVRGQGYRLELTAAAPSEPPPELFGRTAELAEADAQLRTHRVVAVVGPAGVGKTALARQLASERSGLWCDLTDCATADQVRAVLAEALDLGQSADLARLGRALDGRGVSLVVLDNLEQLEAEADLVSHLAAATRARILLTSRVVLSIPAQGVVELGSLPLADAVALLRARSPVPLVDADAEGLAVLLDGLPLAIELAAAKAGVISAHTLRDRLRANPLGLLRRPGDASRHGALQRAIASSWDLLEDWERSVLIELTVFRGGFLLDAAEAVLDPSGWPPELSEPAEVLQRLRQCSLLRAQVQPEQPGVVRLSMFVSIGAFVAEQGQPSPQTRARHAAHYAGYADLEPLESMRRHSLDPIDGFASLNAERGNLTAARTWALALGEPATLLRLTRALSQIHAGWFDPRPDLYLEILDRLSGPQRALATIQLATLYTMMQDAPRTLEHAERAIELGREHDDRVTGRGLYLVAAVSQWANPARARGCAIELLDRHERGLDADDGAAAACMILASLDFARDPRSGREYLQRGQEYYRGLGMLNRLARLQLVQAQFEGWYGDVGLARIAAGEARRLFQQTRDLMLAPEAGNELADALRVLGRHDEAIEVLRDLQEAARRSGATAAQYASATLLSIHLARSDPDGARACAAQARDLWQKHRIPCPVFWAEVHRAEHHLELGELAAAAESLQRCLELERFQDHDRRHAELLLARVHLARGEAGGAKPWVEAAAARPSSIADRGVIAALLGQIAAEEGDWEGAQCRLSEADGVIERLDGGPESVLGREIARLRAAVLAG